MNNIEVLQGDIEKTIWEFSDNLFFNKTNESTFIPMSDVVVIVRKENIDSIVYAEFKLSTNMTFIAKMESDTFQVIYESFLVYGNQPIISPLHTETTVGLSNISGMEKDYDEWTEDNTSKKIEFFDEESVIDNSKGNSKTALTSIGLVIFIVAFLVFQGKSDESNDLVWTEGKKVELCKNYIGKLMGRPTSIMNHYHTDDNGLIYIKYSRRDDNTLWKYVCEVSNDSIIWAAYLKDTHKWGRWRDEDKAKLTLSESKRTVTIHIPKLGEVPVYVWGS